MTKEKENKIEMYIRKHGEIVENEEESESSLPFYYQIKLTDEWTLVVDYNGINEIGLIKADDKDVYYKLEKAITKIILDLYEKTKVAKKQSQRVFPQQTNINKDISNLTELQTVDNMLSQPTGRVINDIPVNGEVSDDYYFDTEIMDWRLRDG